VVEAKRARAPVAAHATEPEAVIMAAKAGVTTIEHGSIPSEEALDAMKKVSLSERSIAHRALRECCILLIIPQHGVIFNPTLSVFETQRNTDPPGKFEALLKNVRSAHEKGVKLGCGGDTGAFPYGENAKEMECMVEAGIPVVDVLRASTLTGWEACGGEWTGKWFGQLEKGWCADLVALDGDPRQDFGAVRRVKVVVKDGKVVVRDGQLVE